MVCDEVVYGEFWCFGNGDLFVLGDVLCGVGIRVWILVFCVSNIVVGVGIVVL